MNDKDQRKFEFQRAGVEVSLLLSKIQRENNLSFADLMMVISAAIEVHSRNEKKLKTGGNLYEADPMTNPKGFMCGLCDGTDEHYHPQTGCSICGVVGLSENMIDHVCK